MTVLPGDRRKARVRGGHLGPRYERIGESEPRYPVARGALKRGQVQITISCELCGAFSQMARGAGFREAIEVLSEHGWRIEPRRCPACAMRVELEMELGE